MDKNKTNNKNKLAVVVCLIILVILIIIIMILFSKKFYENSKKDDVENNTTNDIYQNDDDNNFENTNKNNTTNTNNDISNNTTNSTEEDASSVIQTVDMEDYFWLKDVLNKYYKSNNEEITLDLIDKEAINNLGLTTQNYREFNDFYDPIFRIDEIYFQNLDNNINLYIVKNKYGIDQGDIKESILWIKKDNKNKTFSIYPYEYLKKNNYTEVKQEEKIQINSDRIEKNNENKYKDNDYVITKEMCMSGLFERYKFDLLIDNEHLYNTLDDNYKEKRFRTFEELRNYINENKADMYLDRLAEYKIIDYGGYVEYTGTGNSEKKYVFNVRNMMNYSIELDDYSIGPDYEIYYSFLPVSQAKYCVNRVIEALNYKDYDYVFDKLNSSQKKNRFNDDIGAFKEFIDTYFYDKTKYEIYDDYIMVSEGVYRLRVKIYDSRNTGAYQNYTFIITLKDNMNFEIFMLTS